MKSLWTVLVLALAVAAGAAGPAPQDDLKKILPDAEGVKKSARKLSKEARERVEKALERKLDDKEAGVSIWEARASVPEANQSEKVRVLYTVLPAKGPKGEFKIAVAIAPEERVLAGVLVIENKDDPAIASEAFLAQFEQYIYSSNIANPASALAEARTAAAARKDDKAKQMDGIFKLYGIMHPVGASWFKLNENLDKENKDSAANAESLVTLFGEAEKVVSDFTFLRQSQSDSFRRRLKDGMKELGVVAQHAKAGKFVEARATSAELYNSSCKQCHAGTRRIFRDKRTELGIGNGYFSAGHDVEVPEGPKESFQAAANAIRAAVLVMSEAK